MIIRQATLKDITSIIDFQLKNALETENITLDITVLTQGVQQLLKDEIKGKYYVAEYEGEVVGCLMTTYEWSEWRCATVLWIQSVYVDEKYRGKGVYRKMYKYIQQTVIANRDLCGIRLYVDKRNQRAQAIYKKLGMDGDHYHFFEWMIPN